MTVPDAATIVERGIPDRVATDDLAPRLAAEIEFLADRRAPSGDSDVFDDGVHARRLVVAGDGGAARRLLAGLDPATLSLQGVAAAAWAASRVGPRSVVGALTGVFRSGPDTLEDDGIPLGPRDRYLGSLLAAAGDLDGAAEALRRAAAVGDVRAPIWGALARAELARVLQTASALGPGSPLGAVDGELRRASVAARTFFAAGGYRGLLTRFDREVGSPDHPGTAATGVLWHADSWTGGFGVQPASAIGGGTGLRAIHHLLVHRDRPVAAVELGRVIEGGDGTEIADALAGVDPLALVLPRAGGVLSARVAELRALVLDETVRSRVGKAMHRTIDRLAADQPVLAAHLAAAVRTGHVCRYDSPTPVEWVLSEPA